MPEADQPAVRAATGELLASFLARPDESGSHYNLGNFHLDRRDYGAAMAAFTTAVRLQPRDVAPLVNLALACNLAGSNAPAEASLRRALALDPTNAVVHLNLGMLLAEMERPAEAEQAFRAAFKSDPKSAPAAYNLGVLLAQDRAEESLEWCRRAAALDPRDPKYGYTLAFYLDQHSRAPEAITVLERLLESQPPAPDAYLLLGRLYERAQQPGKALVIYSRAAQNPRLTPQDRRQFEARVGSDPELR